MHIMDVLPSGIREWQDDEGEPTPANPHCWYLEYGGTFFSQGTSHDLIPILARHVHSLVRLRWWYGDWDMGKVWDEECDVCGRLGRTSGQIKRPIVLANCNSSFGSILLDDRILAVKDYQRWLWTAPKFSIPFYEIGPLPDGLKEKGYVQAVYREGQNVANFRSKTSAARWMAFMTGARMGR